MSTNSRCVHGNLMGYCHMCGTNYFMLKPSSKDSQINSLRIQHARSFHEAEDLKEELEALRKENAMLSLWHESDLKEMNIKDARNRAANEKIESILSELMESLAISHREAREILSEVEVYKRSAEEDHVHHLNLTARCIKAEMDRDEAFKTIEKLKQK
jgi:predicted  nucleic acid-binding Zn-ribbon protein